MKSFLGYSFGVRIFFFVSFIINIKKISDNPPLNLLRVTCFILQQSFQLIICKCKKIFWI